MENLIAAVARAADAPLAERHRAVAAALGPFLRQRDLLCPRTCTPRQQRYARHLLHADPAGRFAMLALVWRPGQASPVHGHRTWCAFGVQRGALEESWFGPPDATGAPAHRATFAREVGACGHAAADPHAIHRLACRDGEGAVSLHVYGVGADAIETGINHVYA